MQGVVSWRSLTIHNMCRCGQLCTDILVYLRFKCIVSCWFCKRCIRLKTCVYCILASLYVCKLHTNVSCMVQTWKLICLYHAWNMPVSCMPWNYAWYMHRCLGKIHVHAYIRHCSGVSSVSQGAGAPPLALAQQQDQWQILSLIINSWQLLPTISLLASEIRYLNNSFSSLLGLK